MSKPTGETFKLKLMADMFAIPEDRFEDFLIDLRKWHKIGGSFNNLANTIADAVGEQLPDDYMTMRWTDDGIHEGTTKIYIKTPEAKNEDRI